MTKIFECSVKKKTRHDWKTLSDRDPTQELKKNHVGDIEHWY